MAYFAVRPSMGGGHLAEDEPVHDRPYHFQRSWIRHELRADRVNLRIMHVEGDSMMPTLHDGDIFLVDLGRRSPTPLSSYYSVIDRTSVDEDGDFLRRFHISKRIARSSLRCDGGREMGLAIPVAERRAHRAPPARQADRT